MKFLGELDQVSLARTQRCNRRLNDPNRLKAVQNTGLMDTPREEGFDRLARLAAQLLDVPLTIFSLVDGDRQFFKADFGLPSPFKETRTLPIDASLCRYTLEGESIISSNAPADPFLRFHPSTGPWGIVALIVLPLVHPSGHVLGTFCCIQPSVREWTERDLTVMRELTQSIMTEILLREQVAKLQSERNLRDTFIAAITHDLRTPLTSSRLTVQLLGKRNAEVEGVQLAVKRVTQNLDRAEHMLRDLLDASHLQTGAGLPLKLSGCDLAELAQKTLEELEAVYPGRFSLRVEGTTELAADPDALQRIIENLASNAAKYGAAQRPIEVLVSRTEERLVLQVRNQGNPIPPDELQSIFKPFHRAVSATQSAEKGWGLGLPLVRGFAEAHGGTATVTSSAEEGTCFTVILPVNASAAAAATPEAPRAAAALRQ